MRICFMSVRTCLCLCLSQQTSYSCNNTCCLSAGNITTYKIDTPPSGRHTQTLKQTVYDYCTVHCKEEDFNLGQRNKNAMIFHTITVSEMTNSYSPFNSSFIRFTFSSGSLCTYSAAIHCFHTLNTQSMLEYYLSTDMHIDTYGHTVRPQQSPLMDYFRSVSL